MDIYNDIKAACISLNIAEGDKQANISNAISLMANIQNNVDIIVLPELFSTGFIADKTACDSLAENNEGTTISLIRDVAKQKCMAIAGTFLAKDGNGQIFNRAFFIEPGGEEIFYDKRHLFMLSAESKIYTPGHRLPPVARFRGWNIALIVCYDIRFPAWCRNFNMQYDILIVPANWPQKRSLAWNSMLQARAIENQSYVIGANRGGEDEYGCYIGETVAYDYIGHSIGQSNGDFLDISMSKDKLEKYRSAFPVWESADTYSIEL